MPNFIKYLTGLRAYFTIKNKIAKNKVISLLLLDQLLLSNKTIQVAKLSHNFSNS